MFASIAKNTDWIHESLTRLGVSPSTLATNSVNMFPHGQDGRGGSLPDIVRDPVVTTPREPVEPVVSQPVRPREPIITRPREPVVITRPREPVVSQPVRPRETVVGPPNPAPGSIRGQEAGPNGRTPIQQFRFRFPGADPCRKPSGRGWSIEMTPLPRVSSRRALIWENDHELKTALGYAACLRLSYTQFKEAEKKIRQTYDSRRFRRR